MASVRRATVTAAVAGLAGLLGGLTTPALSDGRNDDRNASEQPERGEWFSGIELVKGAGSIYSGVIIAANGDLSRDGLAVRVLGSTTNFDSDPDHGRVWQGDVMLGYVASGNHIEMDIYVGIDVQTVKLRPDDPTALVRGTESGFKIVANLNTDREMPYYFGVHGNYSTAFNTYWARARAGLTWNKVAFGVEGVVLGDVEFDAQRLGGFAIFDLNILPSRPLEVTLSAGHQFVSDSNAGTTGGIGGGEGAFVTIELSIPF
jgi:hypothetical protein